jgi:hypothetical protein
MAKQTSTHGGTNMPIPSSNPIDFAAIAVEMRGTVARWYNAEIEIIDTNLREQTWNEFTNTYGETTETVVWSGNARVQPIRSERLPDLDVMQGAVRSVRVQVPYDASLALVRKGMQVRITSGGEDAVLDDLILVVRSAINSSYGWNRTIECDADVKSVA